ncbi:MAG TPA: hypothetical protein VEG44_07190 [Candidatus Acidoferrales bacterium]|nr:hypothetical protein [Candidatus Acidoferrales bacterium]
MAISVVVVVYAQQIIVLTMQSIVPALKNAQMTSTVNVERCSTEKIGEPYVHRKQNIQFHQGQALYEFKT